MEAIQKDNVSVHFTAVNKITEDGVVGDDGEERKVDTIVCATGFDVTYRPRFPIIGQNGVDLADKWKECPEGNIPPSSRFPTSRRTPMTHRSIQSRNSNSATDFLRLPRSRNPRLPQLPHLHRSLLARRKRLRHGSPHVRLLLRAPTDPQTPNRIHLLHHTQTRCDRCVQRPLPRMGPAYRLGRGLSLLV